jgi:hypothetical protein
VSLSHSLQQQQVEDDSCGDLLDTSTESGESGRLLDISADSLMVTGSRAAAAGGLDTSFDRDSIAGSEPDNQESSHTSSGQFGAPIGTRLTVRCHFTGPKNLDFHGPTVNTLPLVLVMDLHASKTLRTGLYKS